MSSHVYLAMVAIALTFGLHQATQASPVVYINGVKQEIVSIRYKVKPVATEVGTKPTQPGSRYPEGYTGPLFEFDDADCVITDGLAYTDYGTPRAYDPYNNPTGVYRPDCGE